MPSLPELLEQKAALEKKIAEAMREERSGAINKVKSLMAEHGLTLADLGTRTLTAPRRAKIGGKVAAKYRNPATGDSWSGRGLQPKWLRAEIAGGRALSDFVI